MTTKDLLKLPYKLDREIRIRKNIAEKHRDSLYGKSIDYSSVGSKGDAKDALGIAVANINDYEKDTEKLISALVSIRFEIEKIINTLHNDKQRQILIDHYLLYMPWKSKYDKDNGNLICIGIKEKTGYSEESIYKFHAAGLKKISVPENFTAKYSEIQKFL